MGEILDQKFKFTFRQGIANPTQGDCSEELIENLRIFGEIFKYLENFISARQTHPLFPGQFYT